jgi:predicted DNA-binding protein with PD1-like motif
MKAVVRTGAKPPAKRTAAASTAKRTAPGSTAAASAPQLPRPRTMVHPGAFNPVRIHSKRAPSARHVRLALMPGQSLYDALIRPLAKLGIRNASTTILGGYFDDLEYCVAPPDPSGQAVVGYSTPIRAGRTFMVFGNATIGKNAKGKPIVHCHACFRIGDGATKGGHVLADSAIVGPDPIPVLVTSLDGFELRVTFDPETNIPLLQPQEVTPDE